MAGYWRNPEATAQTVRDGYLYTGDLGYMGKDGLLYVLGRFKSLLIASDGEKYSPEGIEEAVVEHSSFIDNIILYNNQSAYTTALIVPNKEKLAAYLTEQGLSLKDEEGKKAAIKGIREQLAKFEKGGELETMFPHRWLPSTFAVLPEPFTEQNGMINSTLKVVRGKVEKAYANRIDHMYTPEGKIIYNQMNIDSL